MSKKNYSTDEERREANRAAVKKWKATHQDMVRACAANTPQQSPATP